MPPPTPPLKLLNDSILSGVDYGLVDQYTQLRSPSASTLIQGLELAISKSAYSTSLKLWLQLASGQFGFGDFYQSITSTKELRILSIDPTGACDLKCPTMCYYHPDISLRRGLVEESHLQRAIVEAVSDLDLKLLMFMGKEPLLNPERLFSLLRFAGPASQRPFRTGIVTNGRNILRQASPLAESIQESHLDFLDVSVDSADANTHDLIRALPGTWNLAVDGLKWVASAFPTFPLTIVSTLRHDNSNSLLPLLRVTRDYCSRFQIQPLQPPPFVSVGPLDRRYVVSFFQNLLSELEGPLRGQNLKVGFELYGYYLSDFLDAGFFSPSDFREDAEGQLFVSLEIGGNRLTVQLEVLPLQAWRLARILYDGTYLAHMHFLQSPDPFSLGVGSIIDNGIASLYSKAIAVGSHFHQVLASRGDHECRNRGCWTTCFGGWNGAENAFVSPESILAKPSLCTKPDQPLTPLMSSGDML